MSKIKNIKLVGILSALATMTTCTGCISTEEDKFIIDFDGKQFVIDAGSFGANVKEEGTQVYISKKQNETQTTPVFTTTYDAQVTPGTTVYLTTKPVTTTKEAKVTTTYTTEPLVFGTHTLPTHEPRLTIPTKTTTTETTTTTTTVVEEQDIISNLNFVEKEDSHEIPFVTINVSSKYIGRANSSTSSGAGEGMYWPARLYKKVSGKSDEESLSEIRKLNSRCEDYILEGTSIDVPFTTYYCSGKSVYEVAEKTGIDVNKIIELNRIDNIREVLEQEKEYLVMVSKEKLDSYKNIEGTKMNILDNGLIVTGDRVEKVSYTTYLTYHQIDKNQNFVNRVYINGQTATTIPFAKNVEDITKNGIICSNNTEIYLFNTMAVYTNGTNTLVSIGQLPSSPAGYKLVGHKELSNQKKLSLYK